MYEYFMILKVFSQIDNYNVESLISHIVSMSYYRSYVILSVKSLLHECELKSRLNMNSVGIND